MRSRINNLVSAQTVKPKTDKRLEEHARYLEACLCAVFTELEKQGNADDFIKVATEKAGVDVGAWWLKHKSIDRERLKSDLSKYSDHELSIIKQLIENE